MNKEFVKYEQALALKELGFNEPCLFHTLGGEINFYRSSQDYFTKNDKNGIGVSAILYQQAFRWFREKYGLLHDITLTLNINDELESFYILIHKLNGLVMNEDDDIELNVKTTNKEEAESACLDKLIEICKNK